MIKTILLFLLILGFGFADAADVRRRYLELELEEVEGAKGYHVQVTRIMPDGSRKKPFVFKLKNNQWAATLNPGQYELSVRSIDERGVPGEWSEPEKLVVKLQSPNIKNPMSESKIQADDTKSEKVGFEWEAVAGVESYVFRIYNSQGKVIKEEKVNNTSVKKELDVAQRYEWEVAAVFDEKLEGDPTPRIAFDLIGPKLSEPKNKQVDDINTSVIEWKSVDYAQKYELLLEKKNEKGEWQFFDKKSVAQQSVKYLKPLDTGMYRYKVIAQADRRVDSEPLYQEFKTTLYANRSPAAIEQIKSEQSFETKSRIFALASYYISMVNYSSQSIDTGNAIAYSAIGGTGRLGIGTWFKQDGAWGALLTADMSGFTVANQAQTYVSGFLGVAHRFRLGAVGQLRTQLGMGYRELPTTIAYAATGAPQISQTKVSSMGPSISTSLAYGLSRKLGMQLNASASPSLINMGTPNGQPQKTKLSYQLGVLGSLRLSEHLVGFMGYAYKIDSAAYGVNTQSALSSGVTNFSGDNEVNISGHYLNLMLEYGF